MPEPQIDPSHEIIYEDDSVVIVNKSGNLPVHEGGLYKENCLTKILENRYGHRLFPVYRIDRETSGIVVFARSSEKVKEIAPKIRHKEYIAVCRGKIDKIIKIDEPIGECKGEHIRWKKCVSKEGKSAVTVVLPDKSTEKYSIVTVKPQTGRQHQIRVHLSHIGHPIIGDKIYGESDELFRQHLEGKGRKTGLIPRQALHLAKIEYDERTYEAELPDDMRELIERLQEIS